MSNKQFWVLIQVLCAGFNVIAGSIFFVGMRANLLDDPYNAAWGYSIDPESFDLKEPTNTQ